MMQGVLEQNLFVFKDNFFLDAAMGCNKNRAYAGAHLNLLARGSILYSACYAIVFLISPVYRFDRYRFSFLTYPEIISSKRLLSGLGESSRL